VALAARETKQPLEAVAMILRYQAQQKTSVQEQ